MNSIGQEAAVYTDFSQLESLKAEAQANPNAALEEVAQQFESLFMQMMLKSMRDATVKSDLFSSDQMDTYQTMADQQTALSLSQQGGIGLARVLVEQMQVRGQASGAELSEEGQPSTAADSGIPLTSSAAPVKAFDLPAATHSAIDLKG
jgi:flagellar protein FlgJ